MCVKLTQAEKLYKSAVITLLIIMPRYLHCTCYFSQINSCLSITAMQTSILLLGMLKIELITSVTSHGYQLPRSTCLTAWESWNVHVKIILECIQPSQMFSLKSPCGCTTMFSHGSICPLNNVVTTAVYRHSWPPSLLHTALCFSLCQYTIINNNNKSILIWQIGSQTYTLDQT